MSPLVLLHGFTGSPRTFDEVVAALPGRAALRPLLAGHGDAPFPASVATFGDEVRRLAALIRAWTEEPVHLVGYSLGGRLALALALDHPDRVERLTVIGAHPGLTGSAARAGRRAQDASWVQLLMAGDLTRFVDAWERQPILTSPAPLSPARREAQRRERLGHDPRGLARALQVLGLAEMPDLLPRLTRSRIPLDLVVGELDADFLGHAGRILQARPDARLHRVSGAGHNVPRESPLALARILSKDHRP